MDAVMEILARGAAQLHDRVGGPLCFRLFVMPTVVTFLAIRAGLRDAREGRKPCLWAVFSTPHERMHLFRSALKDIGRIFIVAMVLDTVYQFMVLRAFYVFQALIIAVACAIVPYLLIRGPVTRIARLLGCK